MMSFPRTGRQPPARQLHVAFGNFFSNFAGFFDGVSLLFESFGFGFVASSFGAFSSFFEDFSVSFILFGDFVTGGIFGRVASGQTQSGGAGNGKNDLLHNKYSPRLKKRSAGSVGFAHIAPTNRTNGGAAPLVPFPEQYVNHLSRWPPILI
ncbi:hypothetical protein [Sphingomicrobium sediminis]|uniref:Uncharacterized protein n=1 Tax=Sphingomicrobium sediminis TaxID=2950949 RepID=A0A9X2EKY9_9SPHN|nr:hypothetical protein [Sphingomicrobium sediminis]MCM8557312.1 hypothetical protein [Sphingomicrobium sediminis]